MHAYTSSMKANTTPESARTRQTQIAISGKLFDVAPKDKILMRWRVFNRWDELHPGVQANRVVAKAISDVIRRRSEQWITWLS